MKLTSKLETLLIMGVMAAGSYDPRNALVTVEEHMNPTEFDAAAKFLNWVLANQLTFGRGNIRERFQQFQTAQ